MAFKHGIKTKVYVNGYDMTGYFRSLKMSASDDAADTSTFLNTNKSFIPGLTDAQVSAEALFDADSGIGGNADRSDEVLQAALATEFSYWVQLVQGDALGNGGYAVQAIHTSFEVDSPHDDLTTISVSAQSKTGRERGLVLHALGAETSTANGTGVDNSVGTANGLSGFLQVMARAGAASDTIKIQHSTDNVSFTDLITFTAVSAAHVAERLEVSGTVNRYLRAQWTIGGTSLTFHVFACRK